MTELTRRTALGAGAAAVAFAAFVDVRAEPGATSWSLRSPRRRTQLQVRWDHAAGAQYSVLLGDRRVVGWSDLGIVTRLYNTQDLRTPVISDFSNGLRFDGAETASGEDVYELVTGKRRANRAAYNQLSLTFTHAATHRVLRMEFRAYEDGVAFRYVLPETSVVHHHMIEEKTAFNMGARGRFWGAAYDFFDMYHPSYETPYESYPIGTPTPAELGVSWGFPSLFELDGAYVLIHETGLDATFHGSRLNKDAPDGVYRIEPPMPSESFGFGANYPTSPLPWAMPWRMLVVSDKLADIVESNLVFHLAEPSRIADTGWIKPGAASWNWVYDHDSGMDQAKLRGFIDLAAEMGWSYTLIDANWNRSGDNAMEQLVAYADTKNIGLLFWYNSGGRHNVVTEQPRNIMDDRLRRRAEMARLRQLGVRGVKVDFFQSDKQEIIRLYTEIMDDAAEFHLMCDFHGCTIPRGWQRTWPNLISMEAVRGCEFYSFNSEPDYGLMAPRQNTIHPFMRNVIGSMDYTPVLFSHLTVNRRTSNAHEAALAVIFESGIQHFADGPSIYPALPQAWRDYFSRVPTAWDETRLLAGRPGEDVVLARRLGARWYIAGLNGEDRSKTLAFDLSSLHGLGNEPTVLIDAADGGYGVRQGVRGAGRRTSEAVAPFGGFVMIFQA
ncbi:MAG TPA: glycoside hydrolase family 97 catalytic domain-containing protein [Caulobacterales bacterium]|nr:glycoside hydrolase family 97 catalytic domain-containing protein [Caulobacterales bacterium]